MTNIELYINGILCDMAADTSVRLNRQLLNPGELNTKDAQYSYSISLPSTLTNHRAFTYSNIEETKNKFNRTYAAQLIINSARIFVGNFRLSSITKDGYKGNLYIPALKSIKDIFGEMKLNQNPEYRIPFSDFVTSVNQYNAAAAGGPQMAIFPYTLYGVLPKVPLNKNANTYSDRTLWDSTVRLGMGDLAPSINPLLMLRHIFEAQGYTLQGDAFDDEKLTRLYMSYKNSSDYVQPWNYGQQAKITLSGQWSTRYNKRTGGERLERGVNQGSDPTGQVYACDFLDATNTKLVVTEDTGGNVLYKEVNDADNVPWVKGQIRIPTSGFYKVQFGASLHVFDWNAWRTTDPATGVQHMGGTTQNADNDIRQNLYELRLCRDRNGADFGLSGPKMNNQFYYNNQPQNQQFNADNIPKYFPQVLANGQVNFVDLSQDRYHLLGFAIGQNVDYASAESTQYRNPLDNAENLCSVLAAKPAISWQASENTIAPTRLAIKSPGYMKYGGIGDFDNEGDNPNIDIDYSAGPFATGKVLDAQGNPQTPDNELTPRLAGYLINSNSGLPVLTPGWNVSDFIDLNKYTSPKFSGITQNANNAAITAFYDENQQYIGAGITAPPEVTRRYAALTWTDGRYWNSSGVLTPTPACATSNNVPIDGANTPFIRVSATPSATVGHVFLDASGNFISFFGDNSTTGSWDVADVNTYAVPPTAKFVSFTWTTATYGHTGGFEFTSPTAYTTWVNENIVPPAAARYFRVSAGNTPALTITATSVQASNKILNRFPIQRHYTYRITTDLSDNYTGFAFIHDGAATAPMTVIPFVNGVAEFNTSFTPITAVLDLKLTIYLITPDFNVDGTLEISREIAPGSENVIGWEATNKYKIDLDNAPATYCRRGQYNGVTGLSSIWYGQGSANAVVWLNAGELITVASVSSEGRYRQNGMHSTFGWVAHEVDFTLSIQPFRTDPEWLKVTLAGNGTAHMNWDDAPNFDTDSINLVGFLSADVKTDDFIDNFCKAFNLRLSQIDARTFSLDVKQAKKVVSNQYINLDTVASVADRTNTPLGLPSLYKLGFTVDVDEEGYQDSGDDGGGSFSTGVTEENIVEQKSFFSYNWFKPITKVESGGNITIPLAIISKAEVWEPSLSYAEAMRKRYTDQAYRFWYYAGLLNDLGATFQFNNAALQIARVSNEIPGLSVLNYKNLPFTILDNYFTLLINGASHYTELEGFITPVQYQALNGSILAMFNGDLYYIAELGGYDPAGKNKTKIKLIRKI